MIDRVGIQLTEFQLDLKGIHLDNVRTHFGGGSVGDEFMWFFSPEDIVSGDMHILLGVFQTPLFHLCRL
jgi:hypothetical protein